MSQIFANFVDRTGQHGPGDIQHARVAFTSTGVVQSISLNWDVPFADSNYSVAFQVEGSVGGSNVAISTEYTFQKTATGVTVSIAVSSAAVPCVLHAVAFHD